MRYVTIMIMVFLTAVLMFSCNRSQEIDYQTLIEVKQAEINKLNELEQL